MTHLPILSLQGHICAVNGDEVRSEIFVKHIFAELLFLHEQNYCKIAVFLENCLPLKKLSNFFSLLCEMLSQKLLKQRDSNFFLLYFCSIWQLFITWSSLQFSDSLALRKGRTIKLTFSQG